MFLQVYPPNEFEFAPVKPFRDLVGALVRVYLEAKVYPDQE